jgi:hypothetical protein
LQEGFNKELGTRKYVKYVEMPEDINDALIKRIKKNFIEYDEYVYQILRRELLRKRDRKKNGV